MKALSLEQTKNWFAEHGYLENGEPREEGQSLQLDFSKSSEIPAARCIIDQLKSEGPILLWIKAWSENSIFVHFPLWQRYCQSLGSNGELSEFPALLFEPEERDDALAALVLALHFSWDCSLFAESGGAQTHIQENDYCYFVAANEQAFSSAKNRLRDWLS